MAKSIRSKSKRAFRRIRAKNIHGPIEHQSLMRIAAKLGTADPADAPPEEPKRFSFTAPKSPNDPPPQEIGANKFENDKRLDSEFIARRQQAVERDRAEYEERIAKRGPRLTPAKPSTIKKHRASKYKRMASVQSKRF
ncbi:hypothetical protein H696_01840 [Fonticula alba]|uniref:DUF2423 domain-containing protein n=1 Tax=Fonticula alba TaxID=691883 RepID=A0A058ZAA5_FONAL|nr:hypothetical protein H696_01840 [Fonticula alba]KCV70893.1 hypothetical protein H696_01840 [Fonticula alba]|eukprot:XP_009494016.1 hypothetical protein H696_01840 [Fonticula alba]